MVKNEGLGKPCSFHNTDAGIIKHKLENKEIKNNASWELREDRELRINNWKLKHLTHPNSSWDHIVTWKCELGSDDKYYIIINKKNFKMN